jgi:DNA modification methylase
LEIRRLSLADMNPAPYNPRVDLQPDDPEYDKLKTVINDFGLVQPLVWNQRTGNLVGGHQRRKILIDIGETETDAVVVDLDLTREKLLNLALNKVQGRWDDELLASLLVDLQAEGADLDLAGFDVDELEALIGIEDSDFDVDPQVQEDDFDVQDALDKIKEPESRYGDIWQLGRHILMCGDATNHEDVRRLIGNETVSLVVTDPPYNVAVESDSVRLAADGRDTILNDDMSKEEFQGFLDHVFLRYAEVMDDKAAIYVFHASSTQREFENAMNKSGIVVRSQCIWVKNAASFGFAQYKYKHEPVFYAHKRGKAPAWYGDLKQTTVWKAGLPIENPEPETVWEVSRGDVTKYVHPTQKPLELLAIPIRNSSKRGDSVADFFGGSGSTLMTCDQLERTCYTMELDPVFCDVIKERFKIVTGIEPVLIFRQK